MKKLAGLLYGTDYPHLDHIAPMCSILSIPLITTHDEIFKLATDHYPDLDCQILSPSDVASHIVTNYDVVLSCLPKQLLNPLFFFEENQHRKKLLTLWLPHGHSDKDNLGALTEEVITLVYGSLMKERLRDAGILLRLFEMLEIGNYRREYFANNIAIYRKWIEKSLYFPKKQKTVLFAPSWESTSLDESLTILIESLPDTYNMMIKLHPNTLTKGFWMALKEKYQEKPNLLWLDDAPAIYPILSQTDIYLGDHSSIAYDFLSFNRPLYFLGNASSTIHNAGKNCSAESFFSLLDLPDQLGPERKALDDKTFAKIDVEQMKQEVFETIDRFFTEEINLI